MVKMTRRKKILLIVCAAAVTAILLIISFAGQSKPPGLVNKPRDLSNQDIGDALLIDGILLVNGDYPLPKTYVPDSLVVLKEQKDRAFGVTRGDILLDGEVYLAMNTMFEAAARDGVTDFLVSSGYRTWEHQKSLAENADEVAVAPGASEHQTGLAFDLSASNPNLRFEDTPEFEWIQKHCYEYGFIMRYPYPPEKVEITGVPYEPWHYRYVGVDEAIVMRNSGLVLEEYLDAKREQTE